MTHLNLIFNQMPGGSFAYPQRKDKTRPGAGPPEERMKNGRPSENFSKAPLRFTALTFSQSLYVHTLKRRRRDGHLHCPVPQLVFDLNDLLECRHGSLNRASHKDSYLLVKTSAIGAGSFHPFGLLKVRAGQAESATLSGPKSHIFDFRNAVRSARSVSLLTGGAFMKVPLTRSDGALRNVFNVTSSQTAPVFPNSRMAFE